MIAFRTPTCPLYMASLIRRYRLGHARNHMYRRSVEESTNFLGFLLRKREIYSITRIINERAQHNCLNADLTMFAYLIVPIYHAIKTPRYLIFPSFNVLNALSMPSSVIGQVMIVGLISCNAAKSSNFFIAFHGAIALPWMAIPLTTNWRREIGVVS